MEPSSHGPHHNSQHPVRRAKSQARYRIAMVFVLLAGLVGAIGTIKKIVGPGARVESIGYTEVFARAGDVGKAQVEGERILLSLKSGGSATAVVPNGQSQHALVAMLAERGVPVEFSPRESSGERTLGALMPVMVLLSFALGGLIVYRKKRLSHVKHVQHIDPENATSFADVAGVDEAKDGLRETIEFLRDPVKFGRLGGRAPRGILLSGPPGTGKTLLARAAASEARVPFLSAGGASFQEMFAGVGASRVRTLFAEARKVAPCVVFIDEIDALGKRRGRSDDSASADADQMLNQLLIEMDGFDQMAGIIVLGSTNRPDVLDPALLRPGRFDRQIAISHPDIRGREQILAIHARKIVLGPAVSLPSVARATSGYTGADLARLLNEAAILATRDGSDAVNNVHIEMARDRVTMGDERKTLVMEDDERYATAVHEAGHVAVGLASLHGDPIHKVSILPRGRALGITQAVPDHDRLMYRREYLEDRIAMLLGGRAAEQVILGTMTAGAADDIERAVELARRMVGEMGMSPLGPVHASDDPAFRSPATLDRIERAASRLVRRQLRRAVEIVSLRRNSIDRLVTELLAHDTLVGQQIRDCFEEAAPAIDSVAS